MDDHAQVNPKKLFVGNLPFSTTDEELRELFSQHGEIADLKLISDRVTGRPKGIAFVEYATEDEAQAAIEALNGFELNGRALVVSVARPPVPRERRDFGGNRGFGGGYNRGGDRGGFGGNRGGFNRGGRGFDNHNRDGGSRRYSQ